MRQHLPGTPCCGGGRWLGLTTQLPRPCPRHTALEAGESAEARLPGAVPEFSEGLAHEAPAQARAAGAATRAAELLHVSLEGQAGPGTVESLQGGGGGGAAARVSPPPAAQLARAAWQTPRGGRGEESFYTAVSFTGGSPGGGGGAESGGMVGGVQEMMAQAWRACRGVAGGIANFLLAEINAPPTAGSGTLRGDALEYEVEDRVYEMAQADLERFGLAPELGAEILVRTVNEAVRRVMETLKRDKERARGVNDSGTVAALRAELEALRTTVGCMTELDTVARATARQPELDEARASAQGGASGGSAGISYVWMRWGRICLDSCWRTCRACGGIINTWARHLDFTAFPRCFRSTCCG